MHIQMRVFAAWILALTAFILSLLVLTAGSKAGFLKGAAIGTTGRDYNNAKWTSIYYLKICAGNYAADGSQININCTGSPLPSSIFPDLEKGFITWTIGVAFSGFDALMLPLLFGGKIHWNGWMFFFLVIAWCGLGLGGIWSTLSGELSLLDEFRGGPGPLFLPLTWAAVGCIIAAMIIESFEYGLQRFTPPGEIIAAKYKPSNIPWFSYDLSGLAQAAGYMSNQA